MSLDAQLEWFRAHSTLFKLLDEPGQRRLIADAAIQSFDAGAVIISQGDKGDAFFVILEGELEVWVTELERNVSVGVLTPGAVFGEVAALLGETRSATVVARAPTSVMCFEMPRVRGIIEAYPGVRQALTKLALKRSEDNLAELMKEDYSAPQS